MKTYSCYDAPLKVFGVPFFDEKKTFERVPAELRGELKNLDFLGRRCPGARVGFRTDAEVFTVRIALKTLSVDVGMSLMSCQAVYVTVGERTSAKFAGLVFPGNYNTKTFEKTFTKSGDMEEVTLWLPRNEEIEWVEVTVPDEAAVEAPTPYRYGKALYYGSSITEGGCCASLLNGYNALLSRWLDLDYYNFGFSGNAKGEIAMADYINTVDMNYFIYDYDHNAPNVSHLAATHEPFFKRIREKHPNIPVLMMTRPNFDTSPDAKERREVVETTFKNAVASGDKNVYFADGETFFGDEDRELCTFDRTHPNDLGFYRMAKVLLPTFKKMLSAD